MTVRVRHWLLGFQHSYDLLQRANKRGPTRDYSVCSELGLAMVGAGVAASALPQRRVVEIASDRLPRAMPRLASIRRLLRKTATRGVRRQSLGRPALEHLPQGR